MSTKPPALSVPQMTARTVFELRKNGHLVRHSALMPDHTRCAKDTRGMLDKLPVVPRGAREPHCWSCECWLGEAP